MEVGLYTQQRPWQLQALLELGLGSALACVGPYSCKAYKLGFYPTIKHKIHPTPCEYAYALPILRIRHKIPPLIYEGYSSI